MKKSQSNSKLNSKSTGISENQNSTTPYFDLHHKFEDEPDFDCEFLNASTDDYYERESIIDLEEEEEEDFKDDYNDNDWDTNTYDPYLESTYY